MTKKQKKLNKLQAKVAKLQEATWAEIYGTPVRPDYTTIVKGSGWGNQLYPHRNATISTVDELDRVRRNCRMLGETNSYAKAILGGLTNYAIGRGSTVCVSGVDSEEISEDLEKEVSKYIKLVREKNEWDEFEREALRRLELDGEFFVRIWPQEWGIAFRYVEPYNVRPPMGQDQNGPWSFGIHTPDDDVLNPDSYNIHNFKSNKDETVEAQFIIHVKQNCYQNMKRGIPGFYAVQEDLQGVEKLRQHSREGEKARSAVAYYRQWTGATQAGIQALQTVNYTDSYENRVGNTVYVQEDEPGQVVDVPKGMEVVPPPLSNNADATETILRLGLESIAASFQVPLWLASGSSDTSNYASSLTAESPFIKSLELKQSKLGKAWDKLFTAALEVAIELGLFPENLLDEVDLLIEFPDPQVRKNLEESQRNALLSTSGIMSKSTWASHEGLDYKREEANMQVEGPVEQPAVPGAPASQDNPEKPNGESGNAN